MILSSKKKYLQVALNSTLEDARRIISLLPTSDRIIVEAGTPFIKQYGMEGVRRVLNMV
jgi:3-keto-L-gulonate-6-phosphate decarboxylase